MALEAEVHSQALPGSSLGVFLRARACACACACARVQSSPLLSPHPRTHSRSPPGQPCTNVVEDPGTECEGSHGTGPASGQGPRANEKSPSVSALFFSLGAGLVAAPNTRQHPDDPSRWGPPRAARLQGPTCSVRRTRSLALCRQGEVLKEGPQAVTGAVTGRQIGHCTQPWLMTTSPLSWGPSDSFHDNRPRGLADSRLRAQLSPPGTDT